ncbi:hypothetical protein GT044_17885, partial [Streptomyces sp. SID335]|nr:hypothetical protein [Streptomyces sp. SID335]
EAFEKSTDTESPSPTASGSPAGSTPKAPSPSAAPDPRAAVRDLAKAERELADRRGKALLDAPAEEGRLLASV